MKTMKRLLALLLALSMVMPNCLTIASAYDEEIVEEIAEELVEEIVETPEEVVEEVFEEVYEEEIYEEEIQEEVSEQVAEEVVEQVESFTAGSDVANAELEPVSFSWSQPNAADDSEQQFADYVQTVLYPAGPSFLGTDGYDALKDIKNAQTLYNTLAASLKEIANGETFSTTVVFTPGYAVTQEMIDHVFAALLMDMPFNLYWYDKTSGLGAGSGTAYVDNVYTVTLKFIVASAYRATASDPYTTNQEKTGAAKAAAANALTVATTTAFEEYVAAGNTCNTPYEKLMAYVEWIKKTVTYDHDALIDPKEFSVGDCNPWQIIYVFDGLTNTNVVCEGYSKALQYLCDIATDNAVPHAFSVTGDLFQQSTGKTGRHMWNIVTMDDGKNYLVDVTNADNGWATILLGGDDEEVTRTGKDGNAYTTMKYSFQLNGDVLAFEYDQATMELFADDLAALTLAENNYVPVEEPEEEPPEEPEVKVYSVTTQAELLTALANAKPGDAVSVEGALALDQNVNITIPQGVTLAIKFDSSLTNNGHMENLGNLYVSKKDNLGATLINNGTISNYGALVATDTSTLTNKGILENRENGELSIFGTYDHQGELKLYTRMTEDGLKVNDIRGGVVDNGIVSVITETTDLMTMDEGFKFAEYYGQAQVHMKGNPHFIHGLDLGPNWDLHIYGDAVIDGEVSIEGQIQVEPGASLTTNDVMFIMRGAYVNVHNTYDSENVANGVFTANGPIHIGFDTEPSKDGNWATGVLDVCGELYANEYVNICDDAHLNVYGTMTQMPYDEETELGGVIIENHGLLNVEGGTLNQNSDIFNYGEMIVDGALNVNSNNIQNENGGTTTITADASLDFGEDGSICVWDGGSLTNSADLTGLGAVINVTPWTAKSVNGVDKENIYATYFLNSENKLHEAVAHAQEVGYGFTEFMPMSTIRLTKDVTIPANTILQLWDHNNLGVNVIVSNQVKLTTDENENGAGGIIINPECRLIVEQGGMLVNNGWVNVTNNPRGREGLTPGTLWYYDNDPNGWDSMEGNWPDTEQGGILIKGVMTEEDLKKTLADENLKYWTHEAYTEVQGELVINHDFYLDDYGTIVVKSGAKLVINAHNRLIGGKIIVEDGGYLQNNSTLEILEGSVYIAKGGDASEGDYRGYMTWEDGEDHSGTTAYLSTYWVHNFGEGAFVNHDYQENRSFRMVPGEKYSWIFYYNEWDPNNLSWSRIPVHPDDLSEGDYVTIEPASNYEGMETARPDYENLKKYFVMVSIEDVEQAWNTGTVVRYQYDEGENDYVDYGIDICRDSDRGFYKKAEATDGNWLFEVQTAPIFAEADGTKSLYFIYTSENHTISNVALNTEDTFATLTPVEGKSNVWRITLSKDYMDSLWKHNVEWDDRLEVTYTEINSDGDSWQNSADIGIQAIWPTTEAGFTLIDKNDVFEGYNYDAETGKWIDIYDGGWRIIEGLPEGITYDYAANTLTLNNAELNGMHLYYQSEDGETYLPNPDLTIHLTGESSIVNHGIEHSLIIGSGVKATITGDGVLNLGSNNADSINAAIEVDSSSTLTLDGGIINTGNASLNLDGVVTINGATVNTTNGQVNVNNRLDLKTGALNVTALGYVAEHNERPGVMHTHYDAINVGWGKTLRVAGGELKVTIPAPTTESAWFRGINVQGGNLLLNGGSITVDSPANVYGNGIYLDCAHDEQEHPIEGSKSTFVMNGGKLIMEEAMILPDADLATAIWGDGNAVVEISGGEWILDSVYVELNGRTTWNNGVVNGEEVAFLAGGSEFVINGGTFNLTGKAIAGTDIYSNALFYAHGMVTMNGGTMNITNGALKVPVSFCQNGGDITIANTDAGYADYPGLMLLGREDGGAGYMEVNGGTLSVTVPGVAHEDPSENNPAALFYGTFQQNGGDVSFTSTKTAAIKSFGSVQLHSGTMNLNGTYGIGQFGEGKFEASGGKLNINATDTGIFAQNSHVRFVKGMDGNNHISDPTVIIDADQAAIQMLSDTNYEGVYVNDYAFTDNDGNTLIMDHRDRMAEADYRCWVHTLIADETNRDSYATYAKITPAPEVIAEQSALDALPENTERTIRITGDVVLNKNLDVLGVGTLTVAEGATLTISENVKLQARNGGAIIVEQGGQIINFGTLGANHGNVTVRSSETVTGYVHNDGAEVEWNHDYGKYGAIAGIDTKYWWINGIAGNAAHVEKLNELAESDRYDSVSIQFFEQVTLDGPIQETPFEVRVSPKAPWYVYADMTVNSGILLTIESGAALNLWDVNLKVNGILQNNGKLDLRRGNELGAESGTLTVGSYGVLSNNGEIVADGAVINVQGEMSNRKPLFLNDGAVLSVDGKLTNYDAIHVGFPTENDLEDGGQLNIGKNATFYNYRYLNNCGAGTVNISGVLNNAHKDQDGETLDGFFENHGNVNVSGSVNMEAVGMNQSGTLLVQGMMNVRAQVENNGFLGLQTTENGGGKLNVYRGGGLGLVYGGTVHVNDGAVLNNGTIDDNGDWVENTQGDVRIVMGTLYVSEKGTYNGPSDGDITYADSDKKTYLSAYWVNQNDKDEWYVAPEHGVMNSIRMVPGGEYYIAVYRNEWVSKSQNGEYYWNRSPAYLVLEGYDHLNLEPLGDGMLKVTVKENAWDKVENLILDEKLSFPIQISTDKTHGFYKAAAASNENWLEDITVNNLAENPADMVVYFLLTDADKVMTGDHWLDLPEDVDVKTEYQNDGKTIKVTIPGSTIKTLGQGFWMNMNYKVQPVNGGDQEDWNCGVQVNCTELHQLQHNVWMKINGQDYNYNAEHDIWSSQGRITALPTGLSYDYDSNTLTMNSAHLSALELGCYAVDDEWQLTDICQDLPNPNLTLVLNGENSIQSDMTHALNISRGVKLNVTGDGSLLLKTINGEQLVDPEHGLDCCSTVKMVSEEELIISGRAKVTVETAGNVGNDHVGAINGGKLVVKDDARLTTIVPENAVRGNEMPDAQYNGGYSGIEGVRSFNVSGNAVVQTQDVYVEDGNYTQTGGTVTIHALGHIAPHEQDQTLAHTHFNGLGTDGGEISITGGKLNINIPKPTTPSAWYYGIHMEGGDLEIGGTAVVTINGESTGNGIELNSAAFTLKEKAVLNFPEEIFYQQNKQGQWMIDRTNAISTNDNANVNMLGGTINASSVNFHFNGATITDTEINYSATGKTEWNGTVLNADRTYFGAGGNFTMNGGEINLSGMADEKVQHINGILDARGMVDINGGSINITDGTVYISEGTNLKNGVISVNNTFDQIPGMYVAKYFSIEGGQLNVHIPGGVYTDVNNQQEEIPAVYVDGTFHQTGGTVNITNDNDCRMMFSSAIKSYGNVLLNGGEMNLEGSYGIELFGNGNYDVEEEQSENGENTENGAEPEKKPNTMFFANGGTLNINAEDSGILSRHSSIRFVTGKNGEIPEVNIHSGAGALQLLTDDYDSEIFNSKVYVNEYSFVNTNGRKLVMESRDRTEEPGVGCWVHTLMDGNYYATNAILKKTVTKTEADFWNDVDKAGDVFQLTYDVTITGNKTLSKRVEVMSGAELIVAPDAVLTLKNPGSLTTMPTLNADGTMAGEGGKITVQTGGQIYNESAQLTNFMGTITINHSKDKMGYVENQQGQMHMQTYSQNGQLLTGTTIGWPNANQTLDVTCTTLGQYESAIGITNSRGFGGTFVDFYNDVDLTWFMTIPKNVTVSINNPHKLTDGTVNTGSEVSVFTVKSGQTLTIKGALFINNGAKMVVEEDAILHNNEGGLHIGDWQNSNFETSGTLDVYGTANLEGYSAIHNFVMEKVVDGQNEFANIPGVMNVYGTVNTNPVEDPMNGGYLQNFGVLNVESSGKINSNFMFDTIGTTNVKSGAAVTLTNGMMVTGTLNVAGALTNEKGTLHVGSFDEDGEVIPGTVNVTGTLTNKANVSMVHQMTVSGTLNNVGGIFLDSDTAKLTATGTVTNAGCIDPQMKHGTIDFSAADYQQKEVEYDGIPYQGELVVDYGTTFNTTVRDEDKGEVTLRYAGSDLATAQTVKALATAQGYRDFIWAVTANVTIPATSKGETAVTVAAGDRLVVAPGVTLTIDGELNNAGSLMLAKRSGSDLAGALVIGAEAKITNMGSITTAENSTLTNNGTIEMRPVAVLKVNGSYEAGTNGSIRMGVKANTTMDMATVTGIDTKELTIVKEIHEPANALAELNAALAYDSTGYKAMEIHMTAIVETEGNRGLEITSDLATIAENKELIIGTAGADAQPVVTFTNNVVNNGILTNYGDVFIGDLVNDGTVNNYGTMCAGGEYSGVCGPNLTWKLSANANVFARTVVPTALVISGTGEMTSTPWNDKVPAATLASVTTIKLSNQLTSIKDGAFVKFTGVKTITIPKNVTEVSRYGFVTKDVTSVPTLKLMVYHTFTQSKIQGINMGIIHELYEDEFTHVIKCNGCEYTPETLANEITGKTTVEEKLEVLNQWDTAGMKKQMDAELNSTSSVVTDAIAAAEQALMNNTTGKQVGVDTDVDSKVITTASITGAALSASEDSSLVVLEVSDVAKAPEANLDIHEEYAAGDSVAVDMTLTGVDDPENLTAPVTITVPIPAGIGTDFKIVHHSITGAEVVKYKNNGDGTVTFTLDSFSVTEFLPKSVAYVGETGYSDLATAIREAQPNDTVTLKANYSGAEIAVDKSLTIVTNGFSVNGKIKAAADYDVTTENGTISIFAVEAKVDFRVEEQQVNTVKYVKLQNAITAAGENDVVTLLRSVTVPVNVSKPMTIQRGNNFTAVINAGAGLAVTETETAYVIETAAAQLKGVNYGSFEAALAAAQDGDTITLCQDIDGTYTTDKQITVVPGVYAEGFILKAASGYVAVDNGWRIVKAKAQIGEVCYATLVDAMKAAANEEQIVTITMLDNDAEPCAVTIPVMIVKGEYSINLTLAEDLVQSETDGTLTIGTAEATVGGKGYATLEAALADAVNGTVTLQKNIVRENPVQVTHKVTIITEGNTVELTAVAELACITTHSGYQFVPAVAKAGNTGYVTLEAALNAVKNATDKTVTLLQDITEATVIKQEVTIDKNGKTAELSTTSDFAHTVNGNLHTFSVAKARIGETNYASLKDALAVAQENDTIVLLAVPTADEKIAQNVKIDLNGVIETVPVADGWEAVKDGGIYEVKRKPVLTSYAKSLLFEDIVRVRYYFDYNETVYDSAYLKENAGILIWEKEHSNYEPGTQTYEVKGLIAKSGHYYATGHGIPAKQWDELQYARAYIRNEDGTYTYSAVSSYSPKTYAVNMLGKESTKQTLKDLLVAMLNYGATAQVNFNYNAANLMNKVLPLEQQNWVWDETLLIAKKDIDPAKIGMEKSDKINYYAWSLLYEGAIAKRMYNDIDADLAANATEMGILYWNEDTYNTCEKLTADNAVKVPGLVAKSGHYYGTFTGTAAKDLGETSFACAYVIDSEGNTHYGDVRSYSAHTYAKNQINKATAKEALKDLCKTMVIYSDMAAKHFG